MEKEGSYVHVPVHSAKEAYMGSGVQNYIWLTWRSNIFPKMVWSGSWCRVVFLVVNNTQGFTTSAPEDHSEHLHRHMNLKRPPSVEAVVRIISVCLNNHQPL